MPGLTVGANRVLALMLVKVQLVELVVREVQDEVLVLGEVVLAQDVELLHVPRCGSHRVQVILHVLVGRFPDSG